MSFKDKIMAFLKIDEVMASGRQHQLDAIKGAAIIFVVFAHTVLHNDPSHYDSYLPFRILASFLMPLFIFLSGFILSKQMKYSLADYLKKNAIRLLVPFFVWGGVISYGALHIYQNASFPEHVLNLVKNPSNGAWFLWVLFFNSVLLYSVLKLVQVKNWGRWENYFVIASLLLSRLASTELFGLSEIRLHYPYYVAGFFACKYFDVLKTKRNIFYAVAIIAFPVMAFCFRKNEFPIFYPYLLQIFNDKGIARLIVSIYRYAAAFSGIVFSFFVLGRLRQTKFYYFLCWMGTLSLDIYVCHSYFIIRFGNGGWLYIASTIIALIITLTLILFVLRRFKITRLLFLGQSQ